MSVNLTHEQTVLMGVLRTAIKEHDVGVASLVPNDMRAFIAKGVVRTTMTRLLHGNSGILPQETFCLGDGVIRHDERGVYALTPDGPRVIDTYQTVIDSPFATREQVVEIARALCQVALVQ